MSKVTGIYGEFWLALPCQSLIFTLFYILFQESHKIYTEKFSTSELISKNLKGEGNTSPSVLLGVNIAPRKGQTRRKLIKMRDRENFYLI